jgi:hypothetical protein
LFVEKSLFFTLEALLERASMDLKKNFLALLVLGA